MTEQGKQPGPALRLDEARWAAVLARDPAAHSAFVYAVLTTGVYCRPTCPSRKPRKENALFYDAPEQAAKAGFRPCKRCRPERQTPPPGADPRIVRACRILEQAEERISLDGLAGMVDLSAFHFQRLFKKTLGLSPREYAAGLSRNRLQQGLGQGLSVTEAVYRAGYGSGSRVYERYAELLGMKPTEYGQGGGMNEIRYALGKSGLGPFLVAATARGICRIDLGESGEELVERLKASFPRAGIEEGDRNFRELVNLVARFMDDPGQGLDLPLDIQGTAFQQRVWQALQEIPPGTTLSYGQVARKLGRPQAARAVARACAANTLALAVPCHRVIRGDGTLGGYRWGVERKAKILKKESRGPADG